MDISFLLSPSTAQASLAPPRTKEQIDAGCSHSRRYLSLWCSRATDVKHAYLTLVGAKNCPLCPTPTLCLVCPHFSPNVVNAFTAGLKMRAKSTAMTFDLLMHELKGTIVTRRSADWKGTFMGIERFVVVDPPRFNAEGLVRETTGLDATSPVAKCATESWRTLGFISRKHRGAVLFAHSELIRAQKRDIKLTNVWDLRRRVWQAAKDAEDALAAE
jgi:hypothetical protein